MTESAVQQLEILAARIQRLEDEAAIARIFTTYGLAVDTEDVDAMLALYTDDITIDMDGERVLRGHDEARWVIEGEVHQGYVPFCAHTLGPFAIEVDGDAAVATGYSKVFVRDGDAFRVERVSFNRYELIRAEGGWKVSKRWTALLGTGDAAHGLFRRGLHPSNAR